MLADFYSIADRSTTDRGIPIRSSGGYWARCQLHAGIRYVSTLSIPIELQAGDLQNSMADSSTTVSGIPIRFPGEYWVQRQLHASIRYVPVPSKLRISLASVEGGSSMLADFYSIADCSITVRGIPIRFSGGYWARRQLHAGIIYVPTLSILIELQASDLQNSMADSSTAVRCIPIRFSGEYWARGQLHTGMKYVPTRSELMELLCGLRRVPGGGWQELGALYINEY